MAKRKQTPESEPVAADPSNPEVITAIGVQFVRYVCRRIEFEEIPPPEGVIPGQGQSDGIELQLAVNVITGEVAESPSLHGEITLNAVLKCDPRSQPYRASVAATGLFRTTPGVEREEFEKFMTVAAPTIMFPYLRASIHAATADARYGPIRLDPVNLVKAMADTPLQTTRHPTGRSNV
jgi:preprotein translocase subunit SecB